MRRSASVRPLRPLCAAVLFAACAPAAAGLDRARAITQYGHDVWRTEQGLPQNSIVSILQTRDGYLWLGTEEGLVRFDGARFAIFDRRNTPGLGDSFISALLEDASGNLWIGTREGGLSRYRAGRFESFTTAQGLAGNFVRCLAQDGLGAIWIGTDAGVSRFSGGRFSTLTRKDGLASDSVRSISRDRSGDLWIGTRGGGISRYHAGTFTSLGAAQGLSSANVWTTHVSRDGTLWVGTAGGGLARLDGDRFTTFAAKEGLPNLFVAAILEDRDGALWVGTDGGGLARFADGRFTSYSTRNGLSNDFVEALYEDREGSLWVGTQGGGLNRFKDQKFTLFSTSEGLSSDAIWSIYEDREGRLWLGTLGEGLNVIDGAKRSTYRARDGFPSDNVWSMLETSDGAMWLGSRGQGVARWKDGKFKTFTTKDGLADDVVLALLEDRAGDLWIGTSEGLNRYRNGRFETFTSGDGLGSSKILCLAQDRAGDLWVGTRGGGVARRHDGRFERVGVGEGLGNVTVYDAHEDSAGRLWFGTAGRGLLGLAGGRLVAHTSHEGLFDDLIYRILEDGDGNLWMSCNRGVFRVATKDLEAFDAGRIRRIPFVAYGASDGLKSPECNGGFQPAGWRTKDGRLWFPTLRGAAVIDPGRVRVNRVEPPVVIEAAVADGAAIPPGDPRLPPGKARFEFRYTALSFAAPEKVGFRYRLEGFDADWVDAGPRRSAFYTNLPSGPYRFRVVARNDDGVWNQRGATLAFSIAPRYYQTVWFYVLCAVLVGLAAEGATLLRVRHLKSRQKELEDLVAERTRQLEEANRGLERLSLLDPLTGIANRRHFERVLEFERKRSDRTGASLGLLMIDIDNFKAFNDALGHVAGDACLKAVVGALAGSMRGAGDLLARYGGEEFAVVMPGADLEGALALAERLRARVEGLEIEGPSPNDARRVTISVGVAASADVRSTSAEALVSAADRALYEAKQAGRNRVRSAVPDSARP